MRGWTLMNFPLRLHPGDSTSSGTTNSLSRRWLLYVQCLISRSVKSTVKCSTCPFSPVTVRSGISRDTIISEQPQHQEHNAAIFMNAILESWIIIYLADRTNGLAYATMFYASHRLSSPGNLACWQWMSVALSALKFLISCSSLKKMS